MDILDCDTTNLETSLSWRKLERDNMKIGFREGISDGRKENFQESFDKGYSDGFHSGFLMGKYKGTLKATDLKNNTKTKEILLEETRKGACWMCGNNLTEKSLDKIKLKQEKSLNTLIQDIHSKYVDIVN